MHNVVKYNDGVRDAWAPIWCRNAARTYKEVERRFARGNFDLRFAPRLEGAPVLILGSGPSLDDMLPYLKDWKGKIACSTSHVPLMEYMGIEPDFVFLIDADPAMVFLVKDYVRPDTKTILITHPQIPREIIEAWPEDKVYFFRMFDPGDPFSMKYMPMMYGWLNEEKGYAVGSYILNSGNVVNAMVPAMQALGAGAIFLCGYDLGYPEKDGKVQHRSSSAARVNGEWVVTPPPPLPSQEVRPITYEKGNNGVLCDELCYFYKYSFLILYGLGGVPVLSCSRGIVSEVPYVSPKEVVARQGKGFESLIRKPEESYQIAQEYLRLRGLYVLKTDWSVETVNINTKKGLSRYTYLARFWWLNTRPWKWMGGKGYVPRNVKKMQKKAEGVHVSGPGVPSTTISLGTA